MKPKGKKFAIISKIVSLLMVIGFPLFGMFIAWLYDFGPIPWPAFIGLFGLYIFVFVVQSYVLSYVLPKRIERKEQMQAKTNYGTLPIFDQIGVVDIKRINFSSLDRTKFSGAEIRALGFDYDKLADEHKKMALGLLAMPIIAVIFATVLLFAQPSIIPLNSIFLYLFAGVTLAFCIHSYRSGPDLPARSMLFAGQNNFAFNKKLASGIYTIGARSLLGRLPPENVSNIIAIYDKMSLLEYSIIVGSGDDAKYYDGSFICYKLSRPVTSPLYLHATSGPSGNMVTTSSSTIPLDYNLDDNFTLYGSDKLEALSIFTPDVFLAVASHGLKYDIEIIRDYLYIIAEDIRISKDSPKDDIIEFISYANVIAKEISEQIR